MTVENLPKLTLADGSELPCALFGLSRTGTLYIEIYGLPWREACEIFDDPAKTEAMTYPFDDGTMTRRGFTVFDGFDRVENGGVRVTMRRKYEGEDGDET